MSVTVAATKTVSFKLPYAGRTFQRLASKMLGRDGYLSGCEVEDDGTNIEFTSFVCVQRGIIAEAEEGDDLNVPTAAEPWFLIASIPNDDPDSGVIVSVTADVGVAAAAVVLAYKIGGRWSNPPGVDVSEAGRKSSELGVEKDVALIPLIDFPLMEGVSVAAGEVVDNDGRRRTLPRDNDGNAAIAATLSPTRPDAVRYRTDHAVLRQRETHSPEIVHLIGSTIAGDPDITPSILDTVTAPAARPAYFAKRGGTDIEQWWAWADADDLWIQFGTDGGTAALLLTGVDDVADLCLPGQRASDEAVVLVYVDGEDLKLTTFDSVTGAIIDAAVAIADTGVQISRVRCVLDTNETLHIVFVNDEATTEVYYMTCSIAAATFGDVGLAPNYAAGSANGSDCAWPSIGVTRGGAVHVAYTYGPSGDGNLTKIVRTGSDISTQSFDPGSNVGIDTTDTRADVQILSGTGFVQTSLAGLLRRTAIVVTPYDEVYVFTVGSADGLTYGLVLVQNDEYQDQLGVDLVNVIPDLGSDVDLEGIAAAVGEQGEIFVLLRANTISGPNLRILSGLTLAPRPFHNGRAGSLVTLQNIGVDSRTETSGADDISVCRDLAGNFIANYALATDVIASNVYGSFGEFSVRHPRDIYLGSWNVPPAVSDYPVTTDEAFEVFNTRPKRMNFPFLVGDGGDYQGHSALTEASVAARILGGEIVVRPGQHRIGVAGIQIFNHIRGDGRAILMLDEDAWFEAGVAITFDSPTSLSGNIIASPNFRHMRAGGVVEFTGGRFFSVIRNLGYDAGSGSYSVLVADDEAGAPPAATTMRPLWSGLGIENLTFRGVGADAQVALANGHQAIMRNVRMEGTVQLSAENCIRSMFDGIDLINLGIVSPDAALYVAGGDRNTYRAIRLEDGKGTFTVANTEEYPYLIGCMSDNELGDNVIYDIETGRSTQCYHLGNIGRVLSNVRNQTDLNAPVDIDSTDSPTHIALQILGAEDQSSPLVRFRGRWGDLGAVTYVDQDGEFIHSGDFIFDDFNDFNQDLWLIQAYAAATPAWGTVYLPGEIEEEQHHSVTSWQWKGGVSEAVISFDNTNTFALKSLGEFLPEDALGLIEMDFVNSSGAPIDATLTLKRVEKAHDLGGPTLMQTVTWPIAIGSTANVVSIDWSEKIEPGYAYHLRVQTALNVHLYGTFITRLRGGAWRQQHEFNTVRLQVDDGIAQGRATLRSRAKVGDWNKQPLLRMRVAVGEASTADVVRAWGLFPEADIAPATPYGEIGSVFFCLDPEGLLGAGSSTQVRLVVRTDDDEYSSVLTGFTPGADELYYYWIGYSNSNEVFWAISGQPTGTPTASGTFTSAPLSGTSDVCYDSNYIAAFTHLPAVGVAHNTDLIVDSIMYRTATKNVS